MKHNRKSLPVRRILHWYWHFTKPRKLIFFIALALAVISTLSQDILAPYVISRAFNKIQDLYASGGEITVHGLKTYIVTYIALMLISIVFWRVQGVFGWWFEIHGERDIMNYLFNHIQRQSSRFHADNFGGALVSQANKFTAAYEKVADELMWSVLTGLTALLASVVVLATVSLPYAFGLGAFSIIYLLVMGRRTLRQMPYDRALADSESLRTAKLADSITNVATIRSFAAEEHENRLFYKQTSDTVGHYIRLLKSIMINQTISHVGTNGVSVLAFAGGVAVLSVFHAPLGVLFLAINYTMSLSRRLWESNRVVVNINRALGDSATMVEILDQQPEVQEKPGAESFTAHRGEVAFKDVVFRYQTKSKQPIFDHLNLKIKPGEKIGLVGVSGGGKTTITKLLQREMDIDSGAITIDGHNIADMRLEDVRRATSLVPQEPMLFHRSIADNIAYGRPEASQKEIEAVAKMAHAHEFIENLSEGYKTLVGERGVKLSGGQRQRVAIARAMLKNAPILILDEATSALDSESEALIQDALWRLMEDKTAIIIAHRLSTIQKMDRIIVLDKGAIVEQGSHKDLLGQNGMYARLWNRQSGGFIED
ncbi:MAG: MdlB, multidrug/protein/lipid transporter ATPase, ATP-binding cassette, subfamily bacterial [Candidatus Saccharibacteria bacterium]|nr:MdlB, multidrug/protein/lipid transporter ATPase, ATP-binding cassette, subfamily bacterial [Candidatus Saccharibacteria bacterium]